MDMEHRCIVSAQQREETPGSSLAAANCQARWLAGRIGPRRRGYDTPADFARGAGLRQDSRGGVLLCGQDVLHQRMVGRGGRRDARGNTTRPFRITRSCWRSERWSPELEKRGIAKTRIHHFGFAFDGKKVLIGSE